ncbi:MAG TPA: glutamate synthase subunit beta [Longimicrobiales bacterium]|nr:glutamate synthase subunit beta [Longimicrobiales bacterium]
MGKRTGFMEYRRVTTPERPSARRLEDFYEIYLAAEEGELKRQGARCMDCGVPFCQADPGCPIDNLIPEWNDLVYRGQWREAYERLIATNNFPEWTGRICPAPCEDACVLGITDQPVAIKSIERAIIDHAYAQGWVQPRPPAVRTGRKVAIIGSGPAGLAAADQLNKAGHHVTVFERDDRIGGLLMYGVPNMKLDKANVQRRVDLLAAEGVEFVTNANVGVNVDAGALRREYDAILLACGALRPRDLPLPGRELRGIHFAMEYLTGVTKSLLDSNFADGKFIDARDKHVIVIGGGDTGADCIGTALRQRCASLLNITRREREPDARDENHPWPGPTGTYLLDYAHKEGQAVLGRDPREYGVLPLEYVGDGEGNLRAVRIERLEWTRGESGRPEMRRTGIVEDLPADLVFLAIGFTGHDAPELTYQLGVTNGGGVISSEYGRFTTNVEGVFVAGDMRRGASLIVWAIAEGRGAAREIDRFLMGESALDAPTPDPLSEEFAGTA